ncbi:hypothetical protein HOP61_14535 [Halomonas daqingensis]|uniref:RiboL-PSP-HEPN domain-containing protein n=1 Tax=Billgrantia desiderata TaxID=52021 RepID=A0AAW4YVQ3_9GAMM|nr:HEPN domain-containing protein [Halomonas desiderata]MCE8052513.1 hypothetical protein [Halomonas desiderata]
MPSQSHHAFLDQLGSVDQLITIHGRIQSGKGRRHEQDALHKAGVVMTVAAWQAYIEKIIRETLNNIESGFYGPTATQTAPHWALHSFNLRRAEILGTVNKFNTPNTQNIQRIFQEAFDFDPWPCWEWYRGPRKWNGHQTRVRTDSWVKIRHAIAHGYPLPDNMDFLQDKNGNARLNLTLLRECLNHFKHIALQTDHSLRDYLENQYNIHSPW